MAFEEGAVFVLDRCDVTVQWRSDGVVKNGFAVFGAEDEVDVESREGLGHRLARPFRASRFVWADLPGRCPGLVLGCPVGAGKSANTPLERGHANPIAPKGRSSGSPGQRPGKGGPSSHKP